jgi:hypothetical protein
MDGKVLAAPPSQDDEDYVAEGDGEDEDLVLPKVTAQPWALAAAATCHCVLGKREREAKASGRRALPARLAELGQLRAGSQGKKQKRGKESGPAFKRWSNGELAAFEAALLQLGAGRTEDVRREVRVAAAARWGPPRVAHQCAAEPLSGWAAQASKQGELPPPAAAHLAGQPAGPLGGGVPGAGGGDAQGAAQGRRAGEAA